MIAKRHQCMIYDGPPTLNITRLVPPLLQKLEEHYRCMFLGSPTMVARMQYELAAAGLKVSDLVEKSDLILSSSQGHLQNGQFNTTRMLEMLKEAVDQALPQCSGFRPPHSTRRSLPSRSTSINSRKSDPSPLPAEIHEIREFTMFGSVEFL